MALLTWKWTVADGTQIALAGGKQVLQKFWLKQNMWKLGSNLQPPNLKATETNQQKIAAGLV